MEKKEAMKILKDFHDKSALFSVRTALDTIIPELCEPEDEKVRKAILELVKQSSEILSKQNQNNMLTWLEKQGKFTENNEDDSDGDFTIYYPLKNGEGRYKCIPYSFYGMLSSFSEDKDMIDFLHLCFYTKEECNEWIKRNESADKVEPKFKVGDFIVNDYCRGRVVELTDDAYLLDTGQGIPFSCEHNAHLWTLDDAKDGDVLWHSDSASNGIFIFKEIRYDGKVLCYCDYDSEDHFCLGEHHTCCWSNAKYIHPATKEQCDTLFSKMKEAGYKFDFEKKELKRIDAELTDFEKSLKHIMLETLECGDTRNLKADAEMLLRLAQKSIKWSEEDEEMVAGLNNCIDELKEVNGWRFTYVNDKNLDLCKVKKWLKSLKDRYTWKPSKEQIIALRWVLNNIQYSKQKEEISGLLDQIKNL